MDGVFKMIDIHLLDIDNDQPRKSVSLVELEELSISIKENGILQPLIVCKANNRYKIIVGERRFRAAKLIQMTNIPVIEVNIKESCRDFMPLVENIQRENFTPVEEAYAYKNLMNKYSLTQKDLSEKIGKSRAYISNLVRILDLEQEILNAIHRKEISFGHAKVILSLKDKQDRYNLYLMILKKK
ncbi:chromosome partitioning protein ParB, partial [Borreliella bissettiae]